MSLSISISSTPASQAALDAALPDLRASFPDIVIHRTTHGQSAGAERDLCLPVAERIAMVIAEQGDKALVTIEPLDVGFAVAVGFREKEVSKATLDRVLTENGGVPLILEMQKGYSLRSDIQR